jgi:hypothetical protein
MPLPAPYIPEIKQEPFDIQDVLQKAENLKASRTRNALAQMDMQNEMEMRKVATDSWMGQGQQPSNMLAGGAPQNPAQQGATPGQPSNKLAQMPAEAGGPAVGPKDIDNLYKSDTGGLAKDDSFDFSSKKYEITVPGRPSTEYLQQKVKEGKIHPQAAYMYDMGTQKLKQQQAKTYQTQIEQYSELIKSEMKDAIDSGDMKKVSAITERAKRDLKDNPIAQRNFDFALNELKRGVIIKPDGSVKESEDPYKVKYETRLQKYLAQGMTRNEAKEKAADDVIAAKKENQIDLKGSLAAIAAANRPEKEVKPDAEEMQYQISLAEKDPANKGKSRQEIKHIAFMAMKDAKLEDKVKVAAETGKARIEAQAQNMPESYKAWTPEQKQITFEQQFNTGTKPDLGTGAWASKNRTEYQKEYAQWMLDNGHASVDAAKNAAQFKADEKSLSAQTKNVDFMEGFVNNITKQVNRLDKLSENVSRFDTRLLNVPLNELKTKLVGNPLQSSVEMYLTEIANESARLSSANAQSIAHLPEGSQKKWDKIFDGSLSIKDTMTLMHEAEHAASLRIGSVKDKKDETLGRMGANLSGGGQKTDSKDKGQLDKAGAMKYLQKANGDKDKARELAQQDGWSL